MRLPIFLGLLTAALSQVLRAVASDSQPATLSAEWKPLLDPSLSQWEIFIGVPHKTVSIPGVPATQSDDGIHGGSPLGLGNDPLKVFTVIEEEWKPVLHVSGQIYGCVSTKATFENYHLRCQFRWGAKKWPPRETERRDSGILIHCFDPHGAFWNCWRNCLECQVMENDCGDFFPLGSMADSTVKPQIAGARAIFDPKGVFCSGAGPVSHGPSVEKPVGEWNTMEVYTIGQTAVFVVNGTVNNVLFNAKRPTPDYSGIEPLTSGYIQIQSEGAEVFYRDIAIQGITEFPLELKEITEKPTTPPVKYAPIAQDADKEPEIDLSKFELSFDDEFNGDHLDTNKWQVPEMPRQRSCRWVKSLVTVHGGALHLGIQLTKDPVYRYDCGAVRTEPDYDPSRAMFRQRYGYFEARAKLPKDLKADYWAAFWLMCGNAHSGSFDSREGIEADIMESFHLAKATNCPLTFHWNGYGKRHNQAEIESAATPQLWDGQFHRYGMYWDEHCYVAFLDGKEIARTDLIGLGATNGGKVLSQGPCQEPGYVKLTCEAAAWVGASREWEKQMTTEDEFVVDYVRVYKGTLPAPPKSDPTTTAKKEIAATPPKTSVSIVSDDFYINGKLTYEGRTWNGHRIEGLLMNSRMVQATYDDLNPETVKRWAYADTGKWDAERNVSEFIAAMPEWKKHGLLAVTVNFQGGSPEGYSQAQPWITGAFTEDGSLRPDFAARMKRVLDAADANGMVVILGYFYFGQDQHLRDEAAVLRATDETTRWLLDGSWKNVVVEVNNETNPGYHHEILRPARVHELIERVRNTERDGRRLLVGTSYGGGFVPQEKVVRASDFLLLHGNGVTNSARITAMIKETRRVPGYRPMPVLFNEDDHKNFDQPANNCVAAVAEHVSWGWFDFRRPGEAREQGYQSLPVNWGIFSPRKRAFFDYLRKITSSEFPASKIDLSQFKLTFNDEFDGDQLDTTKWEAPEMPRQGSSRWVKSLVTVRDGALHLGIRLTKDPVYRYDCGAVRTERDYDPTKAMFQQRYGFFEARAKLPKNLKADYWAAFWLMCSQVRFENVSDTREAIEADILESFPLWYKTNLSMTFHWNGYGDKHNMAGIELAPTPELRDGQFHRYGMYWDEHCFVAFYDGQEVGRTDLIGFGKKNAGMTPSQGPCQKPCYIKLSCEAAAWAGGDGKLWEKEMTTEDEFVVDYVRVYQGTLPVPP